MEDCAVMESPTEDNFDNGCTSSFAHWEENNKDNSHFGDWTGFSENLSEEAESTPKEKNSEPEGENEVNKWIVFRDCFLVKDQVKDNGTMEILPLSQLLHTSPSSFQLAGLSSESANFYLRLLSEPENDTYSGSKTSFYSHKKLIEMLQLKHSHSTIVQDKHFDDLGFKEMEGSPTALIQTKLTAPAWGQNTPGFLYQISCQWLSQYKLRLQNYQEKKDLL